MSSLQRQTTVNYSGIFHQSTIEADGFEESANFSAIGSSIAFYLRVNIRGELSLYLATCPQATLYITMFKVEAFIGGEIEPISESVSGEISLDRSSYLSVSLADGYDLDVTCEITYLVRTDLQKILTEQLAAFRLDDEHSDVTLVTVADGVEHPAHKFILSVRSPAFAAMFKYDGVLENVLNRVEIEDVTGEAMVAFLDYIYSNDTSKVEVLIGELFVLASKYDVLSLRQICLEAITVDNVALLYYLADLHLEADFKQQTMHFISKNKVAVRRSNGWNEFIRPNASLLQQLLDYTWN